MMGTRKDGVVKVVIAGGGTGGHLFPGIAVAEELRRLDPGGEVLFVGTSRGLEARMIPGLGWRLALISSGGVTGMKWNRALQGLASVARGVVESLGLLRRESPELVVGSGGYVAVPCVLAAALLRIPILLLEQNLLPGVGNRVLSRLAGKVAISFPESDRYFPPRKAVLTGNPIRSKLRDIDEKKSFVPPFTLFVFGGSQGAHRINQAVLDALPFLEERKGGLLLIHQTGEADFRAVVAAYTQAGWAADVRPFFEDMATPLQQAHLVICRAGATTLAEITACGRAAILIPFPHAAHNHQELNARALERLGAAEVFLDRDLSGERLAEAIGKFLENPGRLEEFSRRSRSQGRPEAAGAVARLCFEMGGIRA